MERNAFYYVDNAYYAALEGVEDDDIPPRAIISAHPLELIDKHSYNCRKSSALNLRSLKSICLENVATNMDSLWCKDFVENWSGQMITFFLGPFEQIAGTCVFELMEILRSRNSLHFRYLPSLITGRLEVLNLNDFKNISKILSTIRYRCQANLRVLSLENCTGIKESNLSSALQNLKKLEQLNLRNTGITDHVLEAIGASSFPLQRLQLSDNEKVSNEGTQKLCTAHLAKHLKFISLDFTNVDIEGVFKLLETIPKLEILEHISTTDAILSWKMKYPDRLLNLRQLKVDLSVYDVEELLVLVTVCKNLNDISFTNTKPVNQDALLPFLDMKNLVRITSNCSFIPEVSWFLSGESITHIDIGCSGQSGTQIDIMLIGSSCPKLQSICLQNVNLIEGKVNVGQKHFFERLQIARFQNRLLSNTIPESLKMIFCQSLYLKRIELFLFKLPDSFLESVCSESLLNPKILSSLEVAGFVKCENLTDLGLNHLLCFSPRLQEIHFHENANAYFITQLIAHNKLNVKICCDKSLEETDL